MPGDYVKNTTVGNARISGISKQQMIESYGLEIGPVEGYVRWISKGIRGDLGLSFLYKKSVLHVIGSGIPMTLLISSCSLFLQLIISLWLGIGAAFKKNRIRKRLTGLITILSISLPVFFVALLLQKWLALDLTLLPLQGQISLKQDYEGVLYGLDVAKHLILPVTALTVTGLGGTTKYIRERTEEILASDYVLAAVCRGFDEKEIIKQQVKPNLRVLLSVIIGKEIPALLTKTLIIEEIFALKGVGTIIFAGLAVGDIPLIMGFSLLIAIFVVLCAIGEDVLYCLSDPRIRLGKGAIHHE